MFKLEEVVSFDNNQYPLSLKEGSGKIVHIRDTVTTKSLEEIKDDNCVVTIRLTDDSIVYFKPGVLVSRCKNGSLSFGVLSALVR